jgi:branched-chain amino acid transport system substrate-binding protein
MNAFHKVPSLGASGWTRRTVVKYSAAAVALAYGPARAQIGVSAGDIRIGQTAALTGPLSFANLSANGAAMAHLSEINAKGGIGGRQVKLVTLDDMYDPAKAGANVKQLLTTDGGVLCFWGIGGTPANMVLQPALEEARVPSLAPFTGFDGLRKPEFKHAFHVRASFAQEFAKIASYCKTSGLNTIAVLMSDNPFGKGGTALFEQAAATAGITVKGKVVMGEKVASNEAITAQIKAIGATAVLGINTAAPGLAWAISEIPKLGVPYLSMSLFANEMTVRAMGRSATGIVVAQTVPYPQNRKYRISQELLALAGRTKFAAPESLAFAAMEGYIAARVLVEALQRAGKGLSRESFMAALSARPFDLQGYTVDFTGGKRSGSAFVELSQVTDSGRFVQ